MTGEEVLRMTGADRLSVLCHPEERSDEGSAFAGQRVRRRRSFASLRMTKEGNAQYDKKENAPQYDRGGSAQYDSKRSASG